MTPCCRVCGTELTGELVTCESCQTPHHKDCWEYWGRCATYGCLGLERPPERRPVLREETAELAVRSVEGRTRYLPRRPLVEAHRALLWSQDGAHVRLAHEEVALQMPPDMALELPVPAYQTWYRYLALIGVSSAASLYALLKVFDGDLPLAAVVAPWLCFALAGARIALRHGARHADRLWLVKQENNQLAVEAQLPGWLGWLDAVRVRLGLVIPGTGGERLRVRGISLKPAFGGGEERLVVKAYRLQLACDLPGGGIELIAPVAVPGKGEPRADFLRELTRVRALGYQIAKLFSVPYSESQAA